MPRHHISAFSTSSPHTSPAVESSQFRQQDLLGGKEREKLQARHTSVRSSSKSAHIEKISGDIAYSCKCMTESY